MFCVSSAVPPLARTASYVSPPLPLFGNCETAGVFAQFAATLQLLVVSAGPSHEEVTSAAKSVLAPVGSAATIDARMAQLRRRRQRRGSMVHFSSSLSVPLERRKKRLVRPGCAAQRNMLPERPVIAMLQT